MTHTRWHIGGHSIRALSPHRDDMPDYPPKPPADESPHYHEWLEGQQAELAHLAERRLDLLNEHHRGEL